VAVAKARADADALAAAAALPFGAKLRTLLTRLDVWLHLWNATLQGFGLGLHQSYLFLTLQRMGASTTLMGLTVTVDCLAEFPALFFLDRALKYVPLGAMLHLSVIGYAARLALYAWLPSWPSPWLVLPVQLMHGLTYAWGWGAGTVRGNALAPPGLQATIQGLFQGAYLGAGAGLGSVVGGWLLASLGERRMWGVSAVAILVGWALHYAVLGADKGIAAARRQKWGRGGSGGDGGDAAAAAA
jgi:MFS family permease